MSKPIGTLLTRIIPTEHLWKVKLFTYWESLIGSLKEKVRIEKITGSSLTLGVCHPTWAHELFLLAPMLKKKINAHLNEEKIKTIHFKTVSLNNRNKRSANTAEKKEISRRDHRTTKSHPRDHTLNISEHSKLQTIENQELAHVLERFYIRCKKIRGNQED